MRPLEEFLTDRELYVLQNYPKMSYRQIASVFGVSPSRANQIKLEAERKIRQEKRKEQAEERAQQEVTVTLQLKETYLIRRALIEYEQTISPTLAQFKNGDVDPDEDLCEIVLQKLAAAERA